MKKSKRELIRFIRDESGYLAADPTQKKNGRGGYVCRNRKCFEKALSIGAFSRALKESVKADPALADALFETADKDEGHASASGVLR